MSKKFVWIVSVIILIVLCMFTLVIGLFGYSIYQNIRPLSEVSVEGLAKKKVKYDEAKITYTVSEKGQDSVELNKTADEKTSKIVSYLMEQGIKEDLIQTNKNSYDNFYPDGNYTQPANTPQKIVDSTIEVTFIELQKNLELPGKITEKLLSLGINSFSNYIYKISNETEVCEELKNLAIKDAREKAILRVKSLGGSKIVKTQANDTSGCGQYQYYPAYASDVSAKIETGAVASSTSVPVFTGQEEIQVTVQLVSQYRQ
jgi:uncharacterized protein YggE